MGDRARSRWLPDIARMDFSAVLWVGPPHESSLWSGLVQRRDPGTPEVQPRYDNGRTVRFSQATDAGDIAKIAEPPWEGTRVLFLQHASDPIIWWSPNLLFSQPDWLVEPPGADRTASMRWYPIITLWQVSADMTNAVGRARRARPQLRQHRCSTAGRPWCRRTAGRPRTPSACGWRWRPSKPPTVPSTDGAARELAQPSSGAGRRVGRLERVRRAAAAAPLAGAGARRRGRPRLVRLTRAPLGLRPPALGPWAAAGARRGGRGGGGCRRDDGAAAGARRRWPSASCPIRRASGCWCASRSAPCGARRRRSVRRSAPSADSAFGSRWGRLVQATAFGLSHVADARRTGEPVLGTVLVTGAAGGRSAGCYARSGSLAASMLAHLAINEAGAVAALRRPARARRRGRPSSADAGRCRCRRCRSR